MLFATSWSSIASKAMGDPSARLFTGSDVTAQELRSEKIHKAKQAERCRNPRDVRLNPLLIRISRVQQSASKCLASGGSQIVEPGFYGQLLQVALTKRGQMLGTARNALCHVAAVD